MITRTLPRTPLAALCLVLAVLLAACGGPDIAINGTITDAYTGKPIPAATIRLGDNEMTTDAGGKFQISKWTDKDTLQVAAKGYEPITIALAAQPQIAKPTPPAVTLDAQIRPNTIAGAITDAYTGKPLAGAQVKASATISATTGADGRYALIGLPETFSLTIAAPDHESVSQSFKRTTNFDVALRSNILAGVVTDSLANKPIAGAAVKAGDATATTSADGRYRLENVPENATVQISADGYAALTQPIEHMTALNAALRPDVLKGTLLDSATGAPIKNATVIATASTNSSDVAYTRIDNSADGQFKLDGVPEQGYIQVLAPGYRKTTIELKAGGVPSTIKLEPFSAKALYVKTSVAAYQGIDPYFDLIDRTELNALVLDLKSDNLVDLGLIYYDSQVPIVKELHTSKPLMDVKAILAEAKRRNIYTIARIHIFAHDNLLAETKPEWAAHDTRGCKPNDNRKCNGPVFYADWDIAWLDPWNEQVWDYNISLATEAAQLGFDEINFDYIRFPNDGATQYMQLSKSTDWRKDPQPLYENIGRFMERAQRAINGSGAFFSADVFGYAAWSPQPNIGQNMAIMSQHADYICPMVYPSHFAFNELNLGDPAEHPFEIVAASMDHGTKLVGDGRARLRPWLQDFTLLWRPPVVQYGADKVRAQIDAAESAPIDAGWLLWDSDNEYTESALKHDK